MKHEAPNIDWAGLSPVMADGRKIIEVDLVGTARVLEATLPRIASGGAAVCIASISAAYAAPSASSASPSKSMTLSTACSA